MYGSEREKEIINILSQNNYATVEYLAKIIHASPSSIRRDLKKLEMEGLITRSYGGAELNASVNKQIPFFLRSHKNSKEKTYVARLAAGLVKQGDTIFLDASTSTYYMLDFLKDINNITVITNSLSGMTLCSEYNINAFLAGGKLSVENPSCFVGSHTESIISSFHSDYFFFSVQSVTKDGSLYDCFESEITPRRIMMSNAEKSVLLCDKSKTNHYSAYRLCSVEDIDYIISDMDMQGYFEREYPNLIYK